MYFAPAFCPYAFALLTKRTELLTLPDVLTPHSAWKMSAQVYKLLILRPNCYWQTKNTDNFQLICELLLPHITIPDLSGVCTTFFYNYLLLTTLDLLIFVFLFDLRFCECLISNYRETSSFKEYKFVPLQRKILCMNIIFSIGQHAL